MRIMKAAAVPVGAYVRAPGFEDPIEIVNIENSTPEPGTITWTELGGQTLEVGAASDVEVIDLPEKAVKEWNVFRDRPRKP